uniref:Uncharacterized protein n=2 Tax=Zea mays TaxID=4577 RepID=B4FJL3_MAIZE|nr:unknown [Zea mays]
MALVAMAMRFLAEVAVHHPMARPSHPLIHGFSKGEKNLCAHDCSSTRRKKEGDECNMILGVSKGERLSHRGWDFESKYIAIET